MTENDNSNLCLLIRYMSEIKRKKIKNHLTGVQVPPEKKSSEFLLHLLSLSIPENIFSFEQEILRINNYYFTSCHCKIKCTSDVFFNTVTSTFLFHLSFINHSL